MPYLSKKRVWTQQPQGLPDIEWENPLTEGLIGLFFPVGDRVYDLVSKAFLTNSGTVSSTVNSRGVATKYSSSISQTPTSPFYDLTAEGSLLGLFRYTANGGNQDVFGKHYSGTGYVLEINSTGTLNLVLGVGFWLPTALGNVNGGSNTVACSFSLTTTNIYGVLNSGGVVSNTLGGAIATNTQKLSVGGSDAYGNGLNGDISLTGIWNRALSPSGLIAIGGNPWQLLKKQDRRIWIPSASGGATITCAPGNATTAGITAGISSATTIACTPGGASTAGVACALPIKIACNVGNATPTGIACSLPVVVQCNAGTATTAGVTAGISLDTSITIACNAGNATAAGVAAGISLDTSITISCNVGTATTAGVTAGISSATTITCNAGTATTAGVSATFPQSLSCNVGNATTTGITAQVEIAGQIVIGCNAGTATTAGVSANISSTFVLACNAGTATTLGATAYFPQSLQCSPGNAIAVGIDATFTVAGPTTIVCNVGNATASGIQASIYDVVAPGPRLLVVASELRGYDAAIEVRQYSTEDA